MDDKGTTRWGGAWRWVLPALLLAILIGAWQLAASTGFLANVFNVEKLLVPSPAEVADAAWDNRSLLLENAWVTLRELLLGFGCAFVAGIVFAIAMHLSGFVLRSTYPLVIASQTIPIIAIAPILVIWFGFGIVPKALVVALVCFFPI
ncbi:MAG: ABC transporter permease, partial [Solirubrobacterales bacterium]